LLYVLLLMDVPRKIISLFNSNPKKNNSRILSKMNN